MEQYKKDFKAYLSNLPEDKRQQELKNIKPARKKKPVVNKKSNIKKTVLPNKKKVEKLKEPEQPPM